MKSVRSKNVLGRLRWLLIAPLVLVMFVAVLSFRNATSVSRSAYWVGRTHEVLHELDALLGHLAEAESAQRYFLITGRETQLEPYRAAGPAVDETMAELQRLTEDKPAQQESLTKLDSLIRQRLDLMREGIVLRREKGYAGVMSATPTGAGIDLMVRIRAIVATMKSMEQMTLQQRQAQLHGAVVRGELFLLALLGAASALLVGLIFYLRREIQALRRLVIVCAWTRRVQHEGRWISLEKYLEERFDLSISHGISEEAAAKIHEDINKHRQKLSEGSGDTDHVEKPAPREIRPLNN